MTQATPLYLTAPDLDGTTYGKLTYDPKGDRWVIDAEPAVRELAKRVFPGCEGREELRFPATRRATGDLNWLLLRFPLAVSAEDRIRLAGEREKAIEHALRRDGNQQLAPVVPLATFRGELLPFQAEGVAFLMANERTLLADDMGLGKTVQALAAIAQARAFPVVVVAPANVQRQWERMAGRFLAPEVQSSGVGSLCYRLRGLKPEPLPAVPIYLVHYGLLAAWRDVLVELGAKVVIFDEAQELRHRGTQKYTAASDLARTAQYAWGLSGTPVYGYGAEIWSVLNILEYHCLGDFDSFTKEWCTGYGEKTVAKPAVLGDYLRREGLMLRRRKSSVQSQLPPKRRAIVAIDHDETLYAKLIAQAAALARRYDTIHTWQGRGEAAREMAQQSRQACGISKAEHASAFVAGLLDAGERVLLYAHHHQVQEILAEGLERFRPRRISGLETQRQKDEAIKAFDRGDTNLVQMSMRSTAGLDGLQVRGTCVVFAELDWSPAVHSQAEDRIHRVGVSEDLVELPCYYLTMSQGYDSIVLEALGLKMGQFVGIMGDEWETDEERLLQQQAVEGHLAKVVAMLRREPVASLKESA